MNHMKILFLQNQHDPKVSNWEFNNCLTRNSKTLFKILMCKEGLKLKLSKLIKCYIRKVFIVQAKCATETNLKRLFTLGK